MTRESKSEIIMTIDGDVFSGWESASVSMNMDTMNRSFSMAGTGFDDYVKKIEEGAEVEIALVKDIGSISQKDILITGYIDAIEDSIDENGYKLSVTGRDKTADMIDCSAVTKTRSWKKKKFSQIVKEIIADSVDLILPFSDFTDPVLDNFTLQNGESQFTAIERLCRFVGVLPLADNVGRLVLSNTAQATSTTAEPLVLGKNLMRLGRTRIRSERFSEYIGYSVTPSKGKGWNPKNTKIKTRVTDDTVQRYRPLILVAESKQDKALLEKRVRWEAQVRAGRSLEVVAVVKDFYQFSRYGKPVRPWVLNELVSVTAEKLNMKEELVVAGIEMTISEEGRRTALTLRRLETYASDPSDQVEIE